MTATDATEDAGDAGRVTVSSLLQRTELQSTSAPSTVKPDVAPKDPVDLNAFASAKDRYKPRKMLGKGGMGEVRLCRDPIVGRDVAMKVMRPEHAARADLRARFIHEAQVQGQLEHPAILPVYDLAFLPDGTAFFTMKRLRGRDLLAILDGLRAGKPEITGRYTRHALLSAFATACLAVDFAHTRGVLHRDLKPANIMLGDFGEVYVLDWGLAKLMEGGDGGDGDRREPSGEIVAVDAAHTEAGKVMGTLGYMAPEQAGELDAPIDGRADVFALGAILFEILTLKRLRPLLPSEQMFALIHSGSDARTSVRSPESEVPPELEAICVRATRQHPTERYASARELHDAVNRFLAGDRDIELRRELAARYMTEAESLAQVALAGGPEAVTARRTALRGLGQVLALEPTNRRALSLLARVFAEPPKELPPEVAAEVAQAELTRERVRLRLHLGANVVLSLGTILLLLMGVRDWLLFGLFAGSALPMFLLRRLQLRLLPRGKWLNYVLHGLHLGLYAILCRLLGPLLFLPAPIAIYTMVHALTPDRRYRAFVLASSAGLILGMMGLELCGVIAPSYVFHDGMLTIVPHLTDLPPGITLFAVAVIMVIVMLVPSLIVGQVPDQQLDRHRAALLHSWQVGQILPEGADSGSNINAPVDSKGPVERPDAS